MNELLFSMRKNVKYPCYLTYIWVLRMTEKASPSFVFCNRFSSTSNIRYANPIPPQAQTLTLTLFHHHHGNVIYHTRTLLLYYRFDGYYQSKCRDASSHRPLWIGFRSRFSQCVDYMRFNEKSFCFRWQETTKLMLFGNTKASSLVILGYLGYLTGNISSVMTKHMGVQRKLHRFAYLIVQIILCFYS